MRLTDLTAEQIEQARAGLSEAKRRELDEHLAARSPPPDRLMDFVPWCTPLWQAPLHLAPIVDAIEAARTHEVEAVISTPPQHGKTQLIAHALVSLLMRDPTKRHAYISYSDTRGGEISKETQWIADRAGVKYEGNLGLWGTREGGSIRFTGIGGGLTGRPVDGLMMVDDAVKNDEEAESAARRESTDAWFRSVALTRRHPGSSVLVVQTRWHVDDLAGRLIARGWDNINLPAIDREGRALWEAGRPLSFLRAQQADLGPYHWESLYQGEPRPKGSQLFADIGTYDRLPDKYRVAIGVDLAYSAKTSADWSIAVVLCEFDGWWYVVDVIRRQVRADDFADELKLLARTHVGAPMRWYCSTTEMGSADLLHKMGVPIAGELAKADKFIRAQPVAAAWKRGRVLVPKSAPWLKEFMRVLKNFTGVNDPEDDDVDALAAAFDLLPAREVPKLPERGSAEWYAAEERRMLEVRGHQQDAKKRRPWE